MKLKRIIGISQILLAAVVVLLFLTTCLVIDPVVNGIASKKFTGFEAYLGAASSFKVSVGGVLTIVCLGLIVVLALLKVFIPKISLIFNIIICVLAVLVFVFLCVGCHDFMVNSNIIDKYKAYSDIKLGFGAIMGIIISAIMFGLSLTDEIISFKNR